MADPKKVDMGTAVSDAVLQKLENMKLKHEDFKSIKIKALNSRKHTDCSFLVGKEGTELVEFHGIKSDLMIVSDFMEGLFSSPLCPELPVRIENIESSTFDMIMKFAHLGEVVGKCDVIEATELAIAADHLLIASLRPVCFELIQLQVTSSEIWTVLDLLFKYGLSDLAPSCHELLSSNPEACLEEATFLTASVESVKEFLNLEQMFISSEKILIDYCCKWAQNTSDQRESMRLLLPCFRLLTLKPLEATRLSYFLTWKEEAHLLRYFISKETDCLPTTLCSTVESRQKGGIIVKQMILDHVVSNVSQKLDWVPCEMNILNVTTNLNIWLTEITLVAPKSTRGRFQLKYFKECGKLETIPTCMFAGSPLHEYILKKSLLLKKGVPFRLQFYNDSHYVEKFPDIPYSSALDLNSCGYVTRAHFQQLHFDKYTEPVVLHSFTYQSALPSDEEA